MPSSRSSTKYASFTAAGEILFCLNVGASSTAPIILMDPLDHSVNADFLLRMSAQWNWRPNASIATLSLEEIIYAIPATKTAWIALTRP